MELKLLGWSVVLGLVHLFADVIAATRVRGRAWNVGSREGAAAPLTGLPFRLGQALQNFKETFPFFAAAVLAVVLSGRASATTALGAQIYFVARAFYLPVYAANINGVRTAVWLISMVGLVMVLQALF